MRIFILMALSGLTLAACDQFTEQANLEAEAPPELAQTEQPDAPEPERTESDNIAARKTATIDWTAARTDFAARDTDDGAMAQVASAGSPAVPVLLPDEPIGIASAGGEETLQFRPLADGYFAVKKGEIYDLIINGTDRLVASPEGAGAASDTDLVFEETMTGAQVSFSRYGASYLVEFMCNDPATASKGSCVSEAEAVAEVEKLLIAGTR